MAKKAKLPKLVTISEELLEQVKFFVGSMPLREVGTLLKKVEKNAWAENKDYKEDEPKMFVIDLKTLDALAGYLRILPLYMVGELYTMVQMGVKAYEPGNKEADKDEPIGDMPEPVESKESSMATEAANSIED